MSRVVGRRTLLAEVTDLLRRGRPLALHGPTGIGKSALLDAVEEGFPASVLRATGAAVEQTMPCAALQDLLDHVPDETLARLPDPIRKQLDPGLVGTTGDDELRCAISRAFLALLETMATDTRVLLLLDDAQWLDRDSALVIGYARRRLPDRVALVATVGPGAGRDDVLPDLHRIDVPPLEAEDTIELLGTHGLPAHIAHRLHVESGGLPSLALALGGAVGARPSILGRPTPLPPSIEHVLRDRFLSLPTEVRGTLRRAALLHRPTVRQLERAGRLDAEPEIRWAAEAGLVSRGHDANDHREADLRFTPPALQRVIVESTAAGCRAELHRDLGEVAPTVAERLRHQALADPRPDADVARSLAAAAADSAAGGSPRDRDRALPPGRRPSAVRAHRGSGRVAGVGHRDRCPGQPHRARASCPRRPAGEPGEPGAAGPGPARAARARRLRRHRHGRGPHSGAGRRGGRRPAGRDGPPAAGPGGIDGGGTGRRCPACRPRRTPAAPGLHGLAGGRQRRRPG